MILTLVPNFFFHHLVPKIKKSDLVFIPTISVLMAKS